MSDEEDVATMQALAAGHVPCPSCRTFPGRCCNCRDEVPLGKQRTHQDLVAAVSKSDRRYHLFCDECLSRVIADFERLMEDDRHKGLITDLSRRMS